MSEVEDRDKEDKYEEKGVDEEAGLRKLIDSEASSDEEENKNDDDENETKEEKAKKGKKAFSFVKLFTQNLISEIEMELLTFPLTFST